MQDIYRSVFLNILLSGTLKTAGLVLSAILSLKLFLTLFIAQGLFLSVLVPVAVFAATDDATDDDSIIIFEGSQVEAIVEAIESQTQPSADIAIQDQPLADKDVQDQPAYPLIYRPPIEDEPGESSMEAQYQVQLLQQEVMQLHGQVEELSYQLNKMKRAHDERYLELDSRLQQLLTSRPAPRAIGSELVDSPLTEPQAPEGTAGLDEKSIYDMSLQLIRNRQYDQAIKQLDSLIARFPDGTFTANAYYWLGEVHMALGEPNYERARQALAQVITFFPEHHRVPDAAFKLGQVYHLLGDCARAETLLKQVISQHQGKSVAKLATAYLRDTLLRDTLVCEA